MASIKSRKGNPFEYDTAYSLQQAGYKVNRIDDNTKGVDVIATIDGSQLAIECKFHRSFSWNQLAKIFTKTEEFVIQSMEKDTIPLFIFKSNQQPVLVMYRDDTGALIITLFESFFNYNWSKRPKGYKIWKK